MRLDDEGWFRFEVVGNKDTTIDCPMEVVFNRDNSEEYRGHSRADKDWRYLPRDLEISGGQEVQEKSNAKGSKTTS